MESFVVLDVVLVGVVDYYVGCFEVGSCYVVKVCFCEQVVYLQVEFLLGVLCFLKVKCFYFLYGVVELLQFIGGQGCVIGEVVVFIVFYDVVLFFQVEGEVY